jgi:hypothetical protein
MRTADQIKRKLHELNTQKQALEISPPVTEDPSGNAQKQNRIDRLEDQIMLLEWVLNEPIGKYHA